MSKVRKIRMNLIFYYQMSNQLPALKQKFEWLKEIPSQTLQQTLRVLDQSIKRSFQSGAGFPRFKSRNRDNDWARFPQGFKVFKDKVSLPIIGEIPYRSRNSIHEKAIHDVTITYDHLRDRFYVSFSFEEETMPLPVTGGAIGIDAGSVRLLTDSLGDFAPPLREHPKVKRLLSRIEACQQKFSLFLERFRHGDRSVGKQVKRKRKELGVLHRKLRDFCRDFLHKLSIKLVREYDLIVAEDLDLKAMTKSARGTIEDPGHNVSQKSGLNRNLLSNRIGMLFQMIAYKCLWYGRAFIKVDPRYTSQECTICGFIHADNRKEQSEFKCLQCGHEDNADYNAAVNILKRGIKIFQKTLQPGVWIASE